MFKKERQRPTQYEFEAAAFRMAENSYPDWWKSSMAAQVILRFGNIFTFNQTPAREINLRKSDRRMVALEQKFEGYVVGEEDIAVFAKNQLARYRAIKKH